MTLTYALAPGGGSLVMAQSETSDTFDDGDAVLAGPIVAANVVVVKMDVVIVIRLFVCFVSEIVLSMGWIGLRIEQTGEIWYFFLRKLLAGCVACFHITGSITCGGVGNGRFG